MQLARKDGAGQRGFAQTRQDSNKVVSSQSICGMYGSVHFGCIGYTGSAAMRMEMSAALAEWVSAPTLMKSTPVSA